MNQDLEPKGETRKPRFGPFELPKISVWGTFTELVTTLRGLSAAALAVILLILAGGIFYFVRTAPPRTVTITAGPVGSIFYERALKYVPLLREKGVQLIILPSKGSVENLHRLGDPSFNVDVGFVQDVDTKEAPATLISLGSVFYQPLLVFYRGTPVQTLSQFIGKKLAIGPEGSGTRTLVLQLLQANGIDPRNSAPTTLLGLEPAQASQGLMDGTLDAAFLMGDDASGEIMKKLLLAPGIELMSFRQAEAYTRKFNFLSLLKIPEGGIDFGRNIPPEDVQLIGPTVELIARKTLHSAISDVILEAAQAAHRDATLLQHKGEFPAPIPHDIPISADALRYYRSGSGFFYRYIPSFWLANLVDRLTVVVLPSILVLIPIIRSLPAIYRWRVQSQIYRWYRALITLERQLLDGATGTDPQQVLDELNQVEKSVNKMKVPTFFVDQFYVLRGHIDYVREMISRHSEELKQEQP